MNETMTYEERMKLTSTQGLSPSEAAQWRREMMQRIITDPAKMADLLVELLWVATQGTMQDFEAELHRRATS